MWRKLIKILLEKFYKPFVILYLSKDRWYLYKGIRIKVFKGVFYPGISYSTKIIIRELSTHQLSNKNILELGAGSGLISFYCLNKGANVIASDISSKAIKGLHFNKKQFKSKNLSIIESNLFQKINLQHFDYILINPPFYFIEPKNAAEKAWFAGKNQEYFKELFIELIPFWHKDIQIWMSFPDIIELNSILTMAINEGWYFYQIAEKDVWYEKMILFKVVRKNTT